MATSHRDPVKKSVLITGGCGFLGSHLAEHYLAHGYRVICVDNFSTARLENEDLLNSLPTAAENLKIIRADICESWLWLGSLPDHWLESLQNVFHFASPASPPIYQRFALETMWANSIGLAHALECADRFKARLVFASTSEIYGDPSVSPQPESYWGYVNTLGPRACYDEAKRFGEALIFTHNLKKATHHGMVRIFNTYGPRMNPDDGRVIINFLMQALRFEKLSIYGEGQQTRSYCYVDDLIEGITRYAAQATLCEPVNLGNNNEITVRDLAKIVQELFSDREIGITQKKLPVDDPRLRRPDLTRAQNLLKWSPRITLIEGLTKTREWLIRSGAAGA